MITIELSAVDVGFAENEGGITLAFADPQSGIRVLVPFGSDTSWENFKRHVAADGKLPSIILSPSLPDEKNGRGAG